MCEYQDHAHTIQEELEALANKIDSDDIDYKDVINKLFDLSNKVPCGCGDLIESPESPSVDSIRDSFETYYDNRWLDNSGGGSGNGEIDIPNRVVEDVGTPVTEADNIENSPFVSETDNNGNFITTMKIPKNISEDRIDFKIKNNQGEEKMVSLRLGDNQNRIEKLENVKIGLL